MKCAWCGKPVEPDQLKQVKTIGLTSQTGTTQYTKNYHIDCLVELVQRFPAFAHYLDGK
jgi:hypothetical protein